MRMQWTQAQCEQLKQSWTAGRSASRIANELGVSRAAVLGKLHRLGLLGRGGEVHRDRSRGEVRRPKLGRILTRFV
jgi:GcrA cell cycle regulator